ncbi:MAG: UDP-N-acetylglucosamine 1-carboxyvinyltransferase, partial [Actinomycetota bacterium]|nr:UDP-N-acetylglucosamine 1-carboxyvinyltransferase [Actinomycetota bacterium]
MERLLVTGGARCAGTVRVAGAKNSALKLMAAALLAPGRTVLRNVPNILDCRTMAEVLDRLGAGTAWHDGELTIDATELTSVEAPYDLVRRMRASTAVLGSLLARAGHARVAMPGGDAIGSRPIDLHVQGLRKMGAEISSEHGFLVASTPGLRGAAITLDYPSVGATENLMMAAVLARGTTAIDNAAREPEIADLAGFLVAMGARIGGAGTSTIEIEGVGALHPADHV